MLSKFHVVSFIRYFGTRCREDMALYHSGLVDFRY
ncbi:predicted protein [Botrytis cinerea T4]|uniref:Uncharacterized protein n=1 Tax=Botryotinia fuckeliana (strain T4) TaxID=999810 RepID=G2YUR3_BOTF4|nr:predicted protein [Botrytis cinerea T4]